MFRRVPGSIFQKITSNHLFRWLHSPQHCNLSTRFRLVTQKLEVNVNLSDGEMKFVGGRLCLDFVNTVDVWANTGGREHLRNYGDHPLREKIVDYKALVRWGQLAGVISRSDASELLEYSASHAPDANVTMSRALRLRRALYRILKSLLQRWEPESGDIDILQRELLVARKRQIIVFRDGAFLWTREAVPDSLDRILWPIALSAGDLLTSADLGRLRQCKSEQCGWMFLDSSRNRSRHWCDMSDCGNIDKVRRFRQRS